MLIHRYANEFLDTGNRHMLPTLGLGVGVSGYDYRWRADDISSEVNSEVLTWTDGVNGRVLSASTGKAPILKSVSGTKVLAFDGTSQQIGLLAWGTGYNDPAAPKTATFLVRVMEQPTTTTRRIVLLGGGAVEAETVSGLKIRSWFNASAANPTGTPSGSTGNNVNPAVNLMGSFIPFSVTMAHDGTHELSVNATHSTLGKTIKENGSSLLQFGRTDGNSSANFEIVETTMWPRVLTRAEREKVHQTMRNNYSNLTFT